MRTYALVVDTDVKMKNVDGSTHTLSALKGEKGTLVIFTCNKCPFVDAWQQVMVDIGNSYPAKGISVIFVNSNDPAIKGDTLANMKAKAAKEGYNFPYLQDSTSNIARNFGAKKTPDVFLFDAENKLIYKGAVGDGGRSADLDAIWLKDALDDLLAGNEVDLKQTKAVGCSIKFR
jgi:thioredoxin-related protein